MRNNFTAPGNFGYMVHDPFFILNENMRRNMARVRAHPRNHDLTPAAPAFGHFIYSHYKRMRSAISPQAFQDQLPAEAANSLTWGMRNLNLI